MLRKSITKNIPRAEITGQLQKLKLATILDFADGNNTTICLHFL